MLQLKRGLVSICVEASAFSQRDISNGVIVVTV